MRPYGHRTVERPFTREEFRELFARAARRCVQNARRFYCEGELPDAEHFYCPSLDGRIDDRSHEGIVRVPGATLRSLDQALPLLWREDGWHRPEVRLYPLGTTAAHTVLMVEIPQDAWSNELLAGEFAVPEEPFVLRGPARQEEPTPGAEVPRVRLPRLEVVSPAFAWLVTPDECHRLVDADPAVRLEAAEWLARRLRDGFQPGELAEVVAAAARSEQHSLVRHGFAAVLSQRDVPSWLAVRRTWVKDRDPALRASAYLAIAEQNPVVAFEVLLGLVPTEKAEEAQVGLVRALAKIVGTNGERYTRMNAVTRAAGLSKAARRELAKVSAHFIA